MLERVAALLNSDWVPVVPRTGSLGASGDLAPSAHAFLPLSARARSAGPAGSWPAGARALEAAGLEPLVLEAKEGLALINGTHFMAAIGALATVRVRALLDTVDVVAAATVDALRGARPASTPASTRCARPGRPERQRGEHPGARWPARTATHDRGSARLQDAYSLRCAAQVHGAAREAFAFFARLVALDLDAVTDNPLVFDDPPEVISAGNFHGQALALAFDTLRLALADLGTISERRTFRLVSPSTNGGAAGVPEPAGRDLERLHDRPVRLGRAGLRAARAGAPGEHGLDPDLRQPGGSRLHGDDGRADDARRHPAARADRGLRAAVRLPGHRLRPGSARPGRGGALHAAVRERVAPLMEDRPPAHDLAALLDLVDGRGRRRPAGDRGRLPSHPAGERTA